MGWRGLRVETRWVLSGACMEETSFRVAHTLQHARPSACCCMCFALSVEWGADALRWRVLSPWSTLPAISLGLEALVLPPFSRVCTHSPYHSQHIHVSPPNAVL